MGLGNTLSPGATVSARAALGSGNSAAQRHHREVRLLPPPGSLPSCVCPMPSHPQDHDCGHTATLGKLHVSTGSRKLCQKLSSGLPLPSKGQRRVMGSCPNQSLAPGTGHNNWVKPIGIHLLARLTGERGWRPEQNGSSVRNKGTTRMWRRLENTHNCSKNLRSNPAI